MKIDPSKKTRFELDEVQKYMVCDERVQKALRKHFAEHAQECITRLMSGAECFSVEVDIENFLPELMMNDARNYGEFTARGSYGRYPIQIKGLGGVYFYEAPEFDSIGYFLSIEDAADAIINDWMDSLVSSDMKYRREPFKNQILEDEIAQEKKRKALEQGRKILQTQTSSDRETLWGELFRGGPVQEVEVCADLLTVWIADANERPLAGDILRISYKTLRDPELVFKLLKSTQRWHIAKELSALAKREREVAEAALKSCSGVARISAASRVQSAHELEDQLQSVISHLESVP